MRKRLPGYRMSFDRKKQYLQSRLHTAPVGLASRWKARGAFSGSVVGNAGPRADCIGTLLLLFPTDAANRSEYEDLSGLKTCDTP